MGNGLGGGVGPIANFFEVAVFEVDEAISNIEDAIIVGDDQAGTALFFG